MQIYHAIRRKSLGECVCTLRANSVPREKTFDTKEATVTENQYSRKEEIEVSQQLPQKKKETRSDPCQCSTAY